MENALYGIYALVVFVSEISLVRFLILQHLVRKYCMHALSVRNFMSAFFCTYRQIPNPKNQELEAKLTSCLAVTERCVCVSQ